LVEEAEDIYGSEIASALSTYFSAPAPIPFFKAAQLMGLVLREEKLVIDPEATEKQKALWNKLK
jgi:hypothetical protein